MFSGIVERVGSVTRVVRGDDALRLTVDSGWTPAPEPGASVSVNGVCLTVERSDGGALEFTAVGETLRRTALGRLEPGRKVNLERALRVGDPVGGHWVQGHVDATAPVRSFERGAESARLTIEIPERLRRYVAEKGALSVDGVSLTVAAWSPPHATIALVPYTLEHTIASGYAPGDLVHLEVDLVARYLERLVEERRLA